MNDAAFQAGIAGMSWGRAQGHRQGHQEGFAEGEEHGYAAGFQDGRARGFNEGAQSGRVDGWNSATAQANEIITAYRDERDQLHASVQQQHAFIEALEQRIQALVACDAHLVSENGELRQANHAMAESMTALRAANERLVTDVAASREQLDIARQERDSLSAQHNQALVFITTVRGVLNELAFGDSAEAERARIVFADKYQKRVAMALTEGRISCPLDESAEFMRAFPSTHEFLRRMLEAVEMDRRHEATGQRGAAGERKGGQP